MNFDKVLAKMSEERPALSSILLVIGILLIAMVIGNVLAAVVMIFMVGAGVSDLPNIQQMLTSSDKGWWAMIAGQGLASVITFILAGIIYWVWVEKKKPKELNFNGIPKYAVFGLAILIELCFLPLNGWLQSLNEAFVFPESLSGLERTLKAMEESLAETTEFLTQIDTFPKLIFGLLVIAVIAGVGEELIFRGLIQRKLYAGMKNPHVAIWLAAFIFAAIHMQFYGILPRMMLGAMFGYFFYWTGNLWVPIAAHIFNNAFAVIVYYLIHTGHVSKEMEDMDNFPVPVIVMSVFISLGLMWLFQKNTHKIVHNNP